MTNPVIRPTELSSWKALEAHAAQLKPKHLRDLFAVDNERFAKFSIQLPISSSIIPRT